MIESAIILAAGKGKRLGNFGGARHKSLLKLGDYSMLELSIRKLFSLGFKQVLVIVGHEADLVEQELTSKVTSKIHFVQNLEYANSGNLLSLIKGLEYVDGPCIFMDADIVYEKRILMELLGVAIENRIVTSTPCGSGDEVLVRSMADNVIAISKSLKSNPGELTEYVGIASLCPKTAVHLRELDTSDIKSYDYESYINTYLLNEFEFIEFFDPNLAWSEVDKPADWRKIQSWSKSHMLKVTTV